MRGVSKPVSESFIPVMRALLGPLRRNWREPLPAGKVDALTVPMHCRSRSTDHLEPSLHHSPGCPEHSSGNTNPPIPGSVGGWVRSDVGLLESYRRDVLCANPLAGRSPLQSRFSQQLHICSEGQERHASAAALAAARRECARCRARRRRIIHGARARAWALWRHGAS